MSNQLIVLWVNIDEENTLKSKYKQIKMSVPQVQGFHFSSKYRRRVCRVH